MYLRGWEGEWCFATCMRAPIKSPLALWFRDLGSLGEVRIPHKTVCKIKHALGCTVTSAPI